MMTNDASDDPLPHATEHYTADQSKTIPAEQLFDGRREILIEHEGETYRLRITRRNKLILQK